jgi:hypothetical protein
MGWLYKYEPIDDPVAYLTDQFNHDGEDRRCRVLDAARVANTVYMAVECTEKATSKSFVLAACRTYRDSASGLESQRRFAPSPGCPHEQFPPHRPANRLPDAPVRG